MTELGATGRTRAPRSLAKSAATRRRVVEAAARVLMNRGYAGTRLSDIAEEAELQAGSLYYYFDSKEQLVEEVLRYGVQFTQAHVRATLDQLPEDAGAGDRLDAAVTGFLEAILDLGELSPAHVHSFRQIPPDMQERLHPVRRSFGRLWKELVEAAVESGDVRDDIDPHLLQQHIINTLELAPRLTVRKQRSARELADIMRALIFSGVRPPA
ncbi:MULTISPECIES: TetR/AcrR family transcriptional regulator [unclassified Amycolatopsis]|uniref:TetR/AcrR family transcriptional regulator n=1 Tax=unclassified Amycolatopsis TaxID=2618356 RepID=UPI001EE93378|nr:TetR/AcrR family transcriptional regulator [Amycolatopsis sp. Poz14]MCG3753918.1 TetR/AcrR family transcriptional regulator [Amycolatopsis sp. Poz14]